MGSNIKVWLRGPDVLLRSNVHGSVDHDGRSGPSGTRTSILLRIPIRSKNMFTPEIIAVVSIRRNRGGNGGGDIGLIGF
jgi:hypothetical protein